VLQYGDFGNLCFDRTLSYTVAGHVCVCFSLLQYVAVWCSVLQSFTVILMTCALIAPRPILLQVVYTCVAACCSMLQCVTAYCRSFAVCCSVLQCVAVILATCALIAPRPILLQVMQMCVAVCCSVLQCVAACCSVLQCVAARHLGDYSVIAPRRILVQVMCVAVCCSVLQCVAVCSSVLQCVAVCCSV